MVIRMYISISIYIAYMHVARTTGWILSCFCVLVGILRSSIKIDRFNDALIFVCVHN